MPLSCEEQALLEELIDKSIHARLESVLAAISPNAGYVIGDEDNIRDLLDELWAERLTPDELEAAVDRLIDH